MNPRDQISQDRQNLSPQSAGPNEEGIKINGMEQVIEMLQFADPVFRDSLLKRIGQRDPKLANQLRQMFRR